MVKKTKFLMHLSGLLIAIAPLLAERMNCLGMWYEPALPKKHKK